MKSFKPNPTAHGGSAVKGKRKVKRPIVAGKALHVVFRSPRARGNWNFLRYTDAIERILQKTSKRFHVKVYRFQNVGNHLHLALKAKKRGDIQDFLRVFPQAVVFFVTKTRKGSPIGRFWEELVFSRVVDWGRDWYGLQNYFEKNRFEALGMPRDVVDLWFAWNPGLRYNKS